MLWHHKGTEGTLRCPFYVENLALFTSMATKRQRQQRLLKALYNNAFNVLQSCDAAGVSRQTYYDWRKRDEQFDAAAFEVQIASGDVIDAEIDRRGREGVLEPVYFSGEIIGHIRTFSDQLLLARAKAHIRLRNDYRERSSVEHSGSIGGLGTKQDEELLDELEKNLALNATNDPQV